MATVPVTGTRWRSKDTGKVYEVEQVSYDPLRGWLVRAGLAGSDVHAVIAKAHWFTTEGFEHVPDGTGG